MKFCWNVCRDTDTENEETTSEGNRILIAYFTAEENSDVDVVSLANVTTVEV